MFKYDNKFKRTHLIIEIKKLYNKFDKSLFKNKIFAISGRVFSKRSMGKSIFIDIKDLSEKIQIYIEKDKNSLIDELVLGDIIGVKGTIFITKTKEFSLKSTYLEILSKNKNTFPDKRFGLVDKEICYRQRYLDLISNEESKKIFAIRSKIISHIRNFFLFKNYIEVETPVIQFIPGGAEAKPFQTHHNYLNSKMFLRISPELHLKRLIVGGFEKIFEIGKNFRNEGISTKHNPEFTTIEFYKAYSNYKELMNITEELFKYITKNIFNNNKIIYNNHILDFSKKFERMDFVESMINYGNYKKNDINDKIFLRKELDKIDVKTEKNETLYKLQTKLFENIVEKKILKPTFILHHPVEISPLAKRIENDDNYTERFELYIQGKEIANGFSELNDPLEQEKRFLDQIKNNNEKNIDKDFIEALKYGMPPTAGEGIGIDRLVMLLTNSNSIKDVILFPLMKIK